MYETLLQNNYYILNYILYKLLIYFWVESCLYTDAKASS